MKDEHDNTDKLEQSNTEHEHHADRHDDDKHDNKHDRSDDHNDQNNRGEERHDDTQQGEHHAELAPDEPSTSSAPSGEATAPNPFDAPAGVGFASQPGPATATQQPPLPPRPETGHPVPPAPVAPTEFRGLKGWLVFFMIILGLNGIGALGIFVSALATLIEGDGTAATVVGAVAMPVVGVTMLMAAVNIATRKRFGKTMSQVAIVAMAITMTLIGITNVVETMSDNTCDCGGSRYRYSSSIYDEGAFVCDCYGPTSSEQAATVVESIGGIVIQLVVYGLSALYFQKSRRVKETLVE